MNSSAAAEEDKLLVLSRDWSESSWGRTTRSQVPGASVEFGGRAGEMQSTSSYSGLASVVGDNACDFDSAYGQLIITVFFPQGFLLPSTRHSSAF